MRVIFMGTPDFAEASLRQLIADGFELCAVFTQPDKARGRGMQTSFSPVKECALEHNIPVFQPTTLRDPALLNEIKAFQADIIAVVAYGKLLPDELLTSARFGAVNLHGSLLPKYRGAAPIQWAVLNGDTRTGVCTFYLAAEMDAGDIIYEEETVIGEMETSGELYDRLKVQGAALLSRTLRDIDAGVAPRIPQDHTKASYVTRLGKELSPIDWNKTPREIVKWICGLQPWPVATMELQGQTVKVFAAAYSDQKTDSAPGTVLSGGEKGILVSCGGGTALYITELQAPGKKRMSAADYLRGHPLKR
ncbi:MAG: methionyl-tRNA formyltransferase [Oscillospiraceae bacterium]|nr:methionyl-tRNA formyltransferase [Oscillospiraceae bacterium]